MQKISNALRELIEGNPFLQTGLRHRLLNLSQLARFVLPQLKARTKKQVQPSAVLMSLSRLQRELAVDPKAKSSSFKIHNMTANSDLVVMTFMKTVHVHKGVNEFYTRLQKQSAYITVTEGANEITIIFNKDHLPRLKGSIGEKPVFQNLHVASLALKFDLRYARVPGFLYFILQQLYFQNINIVELASTASELIIYLEEGDLRLAFDTIYNGFVRTGTPQ